MKKLLSLLGAVGLMATSSATVISCGTDPQGENEGVDNGKYGPIANIWNKTDFGQIDVTSGSEALVNNACAQALQKQVKAAQKDPTEIDSSIESESNEYYKLEASIDGIYSSVYNDNDNSPIVKDSTNITFKLTKEFMSENGIDAEYFNENSSVTFTFSFNVTVTE
jgi:hypothetical protein